MFRASARERSGPELEEMERRRLSEWPSWYETASQNRLRYSVIRRCASPMLIYADAIAAGDGCAVGIPMSLPDQDFAGGVLDMGLFRY